MNSGLSRIARDVVSRMHAESDQLGIEVAQLGWDYDDSPFPWRCVPIHDHANWGENDICNAWFKLFGNRQGVIFSCWDPSRCFNLSAQSGKIPVQLWGYFALDAIDSNGGLGGPAAAALTRYERCLGYGAWGASIIEGVLRDAQRPRAVEWLPHGIDTEVFKPTDATATLVGSVMANIGRKDFGTLFKAWRIMAERDPTLKFWLHTNYEVIPQAWSVHELAAQFKIPFTLSGPEALNAALSDEQLASMYSQCLVTMLPSTGEGFGYPIVESMACGTPVIHTDYAGGAELIPRAEWRVPCTDFRLEGQYVLQRPILDAQAFADQALAAIAWKRAEPAVMSAYCAGAVAHLGWSNLWPRWRQWLLVGLENMR